MLNHHHHHRLPLIINLFNSFSIFTLFCKSFLRFISYDIWDIFTACYQSIDIEICFFKNFCYCTSSKPNKSPLLTINQTIFFPMLFIYNGRVKCRFCRIESASILRRINASFLTFIAFLFSFTRKFEISDLISKSIKVSNWFNTKFKFK